MVNYDKINDNIEFRLIKEDVGFEAYTMHDHASTYSEMVWEFYTHLVLPKDNFLVMSQVHGQTVRSFKQARLLHVTSRLLMMSWIASFTVGFLS